MELTKTIKNVFKTDVILIIVFYTIAFGAILINDGVYYDDWVVFRQDPTLVIEHFKELGFFLYWPAYLYNFLLSFKAGIFVQKFLIFFSFLLSAFLFYNILKKIKEIDPNSRLFITLLFILFPVNFARIAICTIHYTLSYFMFFAGFWLLTIGLENRKIIFRIIALLFLFFSFSTNSFLVFYSIVIFYILYYERKNINSIYTFFSRAIKYIDFLLLPILFWIIKYLFFKPYGVLYEGYNIISIPHVIVFPFHSLLAFYESFLRPITMSFGYNSTTLLFVIIMSLILYFIIKNRDYNIKTHYADNKNLIFLLIGAGVFLISVFPYLATGKTPIIDDWRSRHQLLIPLGASLILYFGLRIIMKEVGLRYKTHAFVLSFIIVSFTINNFTNYLAFQKDWFKVLSFIENLKTDNLIKENTTFLFEDRTLDMNANNRVYRDHEIHGIMRYVFGDDTRFVADIKYYNNFEELENYFERNKKNISYPLLNCSNYKLQRPQCIIYINYGETNLTTMKVIKLSGNNIFKYNPEKFKNEIKGIIKLETIKINNNSSNTGINE